PVLAKLRGSGNCASESTPCAFRRTADQVRRTGILPVSSRLSQAGGLPCNRPKGLAHTSPGQRPGNLVISIALQANGLPHKKGLLDVRIMRRAFSALRHIRGPGPRALPWAGMIHAPGVNQKT